MVNCVGQSVTPFHQRPQHGTVSPNMPHILTRSQENLAYAATVHSVSCFLTGNARKKKSRTAIDKAPTHWNSRTATNSTESFTLAFTIAAGSSPKYTAFVSQGPAKQKSRRVLASTSLPNATNENPMCKWNYVALSSELFAQHHWIKLTEDMSE